MNQPNAWINYGAGMAYMKKKRYEAAGEKFRELLASHPHYGDAIAQLGIIEKSHARRNTAKRYFQEALNQDPENEIANYQIGLFHLEDKKYSAAEDYFTKIIKRNPSHIDSLTHLGIVRARKGEFDAAERLISEAYDKDPTRKDGFARLGWIKAEHVDWPGALTLMNKDSKSGRLSPAGMVMLAQIHGRLDDFRTAMRLIEKAYRQNKAVKDGYAKLGWIKMENNHWSDAWELFDKDSEKNRLSPFWKINFALVELHLDRWTEAAARVDRAYAEHQSLCDGFSRLGWNGYLLGKSEMFFNEYIQKDVKIGRLSWKGTLFRGLCHTTKGSLSEALQLIEPVYSKEIKEKNWLATIGWHCIRENSTVRGIELMTRDFSMGRMNTGWLPTYAVALSIGGKISQALTVLADAGITKQSSVLFPIGFKTCPDAILEATQLWELASGGMNYNALKVIDKPF
jgi:tetratricopeptide (TPR) repeat protein